VRLLRSAVSRGQEAADPLYIAVTVQILTERIRGGVRLVQGLIHRLNIWDKRIWSRVLWRGCFILGEERGKLRGRP